jgi:hypothetical protein
LASTVGLGSARKILAVEVFWPTSQTRQVFRDVLFDHAIEITEGLQEFRVLSWAPIAVP